MISLRAGIAIASGVALFGAGWYAASIVAENRYQDVIIEQQEAHALALSEARKKEQDLQTNVDQIKRLADEKITVLNRRVNNLIGELRNRPERPASGVPESTSAEPAKCTGQGLYRDDAEFLVRLAQDADATREALSQCKAAYEALQ